MNGIDAIRILKQTCPQSKVMIITVFEDDEKIYTSLAAGANGYLLKKTVAAELLVAIEEIMSGGSPMNARIARRVVASFRSNAPEKNSEALKDLSKREWELLELLSKGFRYKDIAEQLFISTDTVRTHIRNIYIKLQVNSMVMDINKAFN
jgi:DNA-binding NarL/FixJ family response regulator